MIIEKGFIASSRKFFKAKYIGSEKIKSLDKNVEKICSVWTFDCQPKIDSERVTHLANKDEFNILLEIKNAHLVLEVWHFEDDCLVGGDIPQISYPRMEDLLEEWEITSNYNHIYPKKDLYPSEI
jgi:hypothetical protein